MPLTDGDREEIIRAAVKNATSKNITLAIQSWGIEWSDKKDRWIPKKEQRCCALGCVLLENQDKLNIKNWRSLTLETLLDCNSEWICSFQRGWDGYPSDNSFIHDLGLMMREELVKDTQLKMPGM